MNRLFYLSLGLLDILSGIIILAFAPREVFYLVIGILILLKGVWTLIS